MRNEGHLLRVLGIVFGVAAVVGSVVGQGILRAPAAVAEASTSSYVIIGLWVVGALIALVSAMPFAELGAAIPNAGGAYAYAARAFGDKIAVGVAFAVMMTFITAEAQLAFVLGEYLNRIGVGSGSISPGAFGIGALALFCLLNAAGTRVGGASQVMFSTLKGLVLIGLVMVFFANPSAGVTVDALPVHGGFFVFVTAITLIISTYNGWDNVVLYGEEIDNPARSIPRAMFGGIAGVAALYLLVNVSLLHLLGAEGMKGSNFAAADAAGIVFGANGDTILTAFGILSVAAITSLGLMSSTRITYAAARAGLLPHVLVKVGKRGTPIRAMIFVAVLASLFIVSGTYLALSSAAVAINQVMLMSVSVSAIGLRLREPDMPRPFRMPWFWPMIALGLLVNSVLLIIVIAQNPVYALSGFVAVGVLWVGYLLFARGTPHALVETEEAA